MAKKSKNKTGSVKRSNRLRTKLIKQGKLKIKRNKSRQQKLIRTKSTANHADDEERNSSENEDVLDMFENEDMSFLQNAIENNSYSLYNNIDSKGERLKSRRLKRKAETEEDLKNVESQYEETLQTESVKKKTKYLLPLKTSKGLIMRSEEVKSSEDEDEDEDGGEDSENVDKHILEYDKQNKSELLGISEAEEIRCVDLLACRKNSLGKKKLKIGILCSGLTENPEQKITNFKPLLEMLKESDPEVCITVKKLVLVSMLEVFKDLLPEYQIKHHTDPKVKLKKTVKQLQNYENSLLRYYKNYLKEVEKFVKVLKRKKGDNRVVNEAEVHLAELAVKCLCDLLNAHPYFNFSKNIIHLLVPFLNNGREKIRETILNGLKTLFKIDKRGEMSLEVVRNINKFVKSKNNRVHHCEVLSVLLSLNLNNVNLDREKEDEIRHKKAEAKKHKLLMISKRERKRIKKLKSLEKDLLETKAEESKKSKEQHLTEITKILFTIYFRILKETASSKLLNAALEGIAKFAHCINIEFYQDLIKVLDGLVQNDNLGYKEKLSCVRTVFTVLHYQGATIYIDPIRFYSHFYANILQINAGANHSDLPLILKTVDFVLLKRRKHLTLQRLLAFTKRLTTLALQVLPNGTLSLLSSIKEILQVNNSTDLLLDFDSAGGQGIYYPEMEEPEYCNASAASLWELTLLQKHYHPTAREFALHMAKAEHKSEDVSQSKNVFKQTPEQLFEQYDASGVKFNPAIPAPRKFPKNKARPRLLNQELEDYTNRIVQEVKLSEVFFLSNEDCKKRKSKYSS